MRKVKKEVNSTGKSTKIRDTKVMNKNKVPKMPRLCLISYIVIESIINTQSIGRFLNR